MKRRQFLLLAASAPLSVRLRANTAGWATHCAEQTPPVTLARPERIVQLGRARVDDYAWLKPSNWKEVWKDPSTLGKDIRAHLDAEDCYASQVLASTLPLQRKLFAEMSGRSGEDDAPPPYPAGDWLYYERYPPGAQQPNWYRRRRDGNAGEELLLDGSARAGANPSFTIINATPSPDQNLFAWAEDATGSERYRIQVKDLRTGTLLPNAAENAYGDFEFSADSQWIFWVYRDSNSRPSVVFRRQARGGRDILVYHEPAADVLMTVTSTSSDRYLMIYSWNATSSEVRLISNAKPTEVPRVVEPRTKGMIYSVEDWNGHLAILTNADGATNFKLMRVKESDPARRNWRDWIPYDPKIYITGMRAFRGHFVRVEREDANPRLVVTHDKDMSETSIVHDTAAYDMEVSTHQEYESQVLHYVFQSPKQPPQWIAYDMAKASSAILKTRQVGGGFRSENYVVERIFAAASDGSRVPVTALRRRDTKLDGSAPLMMYGYGSYGVFINPEFASDIFSLVDRGWVYAIAHVRGGSAMGWSWYLQARKLHKKVTFTDFISCTEALIHRGYGSKGRVVMYGFSAGGLLAGAVLNMRPDLFSGVIAEAPFVDMLNTMSDPTHPLVPLTYPDWGNPLASMDVYDYMASYSPYDNVKPQAYPAVLATTSVADDRVGFWEPAKWIAKLRANDTSHSPKMLRLEMGGHGGSSGRLAGLRQMALFYAFSIWTVTRHCA
ncbi:MAG: S9 family peptidase [Steroidobacteraceae bacterium]